MDQATHNKIISFIWGIADDVLRDLYVRGKYRDVILPMIVLRRLDAVLENRKQDANAIATIYFNLKQKFSGKVVPTVKVTTISDPDGRELLVIRQTEETSIQ